MDGEQQLSEVDGNDQSEESEHCFSNRNGARPAMSNDHRTQFCEFIRHDAEEAKKLGKSLKDYLPHMSKLIREWQQEFRDAPTYEEGRTTAEEVYGLRLPKPAAAVVSSAFEFAKKEFKEPEVMLEVAGSESAVLHHPNLGELHAYRGVGKDKLHHRILQCAGNR